MKILMLHICQFLFPKGIPLHCSIMLCPSMCKNDNGQGLQTWKSDRDCIAVLREAGIWVAPSGIIPHRSQLGESQKCEVAPHGVQGVCCVRSNQSFK